jgi:hypothetical protein
MRTPVILILAGALLAVAGVGGWVAADRLMGDDGGPVVTPTPTRTGTATPSASGTPGAGGPTLLYREFGSGADTLWIAPVASPTDRKSVAQIEHAPDWGISASVSSDGSQVAYLVLTSGGQDPDREAQAWVLDVGSGEKRHLADGFDLRTRPLWSLVGDAIVVRRNGLREESGNRQITLLHLDPRTGDEKELVAEPAFELFPMGYNDGVLLYARIQGAATDFVSLGSSGDVRGVTSVSNESARDWHLSPFGTHVAFLARQRTDGRIAMRAFVVELIPGAAPQALSDVAPALDAGDHFNPVWREESTVTVGRTPAEGETAAAAVVVSLVTGTVEEVEPGPEQGFDVPVAWFSGGRYLVVRSFEGSSAADAGRERLTIIDERSGRKAVGEQGSLEFIGWLPGGSR